MSVDINKDTYLEEYTYNGFNQMKTAQKDGKTASYTYNGDGLRMSKTVDGLTTNHTWDGTNLVLDTQGSESTLYLRANGLVASIKGNTIQKYVFDAHGDVVQLTNLNGAVTKNYTYDAFGVEKEIDENDSNPFRYCGEYYDSETGSIYLRARYYSPTRGRFTTEDPVMDGFNWYGYCNGNPVLLIDAVGLAPTAKEAAAMADHIYQDIPMSDADDPNGNRALRTVEGWRLITVWTGREGMKMGIYIRDTDDWQNPSEYAVVFKGTTPTNFENWKNNIEQAISNKSADMWDAINYAKGFVESIGDTEVTFVGHSKGGAEAAAAAVATNKDAILFNPANANLSDYDLDANNYTANMTQYVVRYEILTVLRLGPVSKNRVPTIKTVLLKRQHDGLSIFGQIQNHSMDAVKKGLE